MKATSNLIMLTAVLLLSFGVQAQSYKLNNKTSSIVIEGTSNIHDWEIEVEKMSGEIHAVFENEKLVKLENLNITIPGTSLKSGKGGMDKNTYKALNTDKNPDITYKLEKVEKIDYTSDKKCLITTLGKLKIAGSSRPIKIIFESKVSEGKMELIGNKELNMNDFGVAPPTAMFGTITTGEIVNVKFQTVFNK